MKKIFLSSKKNVALSGMIVISFFTNLAFANYPVIDLSNLLYSIEQVSAMYNQINQTIEQVKNQYEMIKQTATQMASFDVDKFKNLGDNFNGLDSGNPWEKAGTAISASKKTAQDIVKATNDELNKIDRFEHALTDQNISFGGINYSMADLCGVGDPNKDVLDFTVNSFNYTQDVCEDIGRTYTEGLTPEEKIAIMQEYGMSPENYGKIKASEAILADLVTQSNVLGTSTAASHYLEDSIANANAICRTVEELDDGNMYALAQISAKALGSLPIDFSRLVNAINRNTAIASQQITSDVTKNAVKEEQKAKEMRNILNGSNTGGMDSSTRYF